MPPSTSAPSKSKKGVSFSAALRQTPQPDARTVDLVGHQPPIDTLDAGLKDLKSVRRLSLSTNTISTIQNIPENVVILSLGRNTIKRLDGVQAAAKSLEQLWISYNAVDSLKGVEAMGNLRVLYASNNSISSWEEIDRLAGLQHLQDVLFIGNPLHARYHAKGNGAAVDGPATYIREMRTRLVHLKKLDGKLLDSAQDETDEIDEGIDPPPGCCKPPPVAAA